MDWWLPVIAVKGGELKRSIVKEIEAICSWTEGSSAEDGQVVGGVMVN